MRKILSRNHKSVFLSFFALFFLIGQPQEFGQENLFFQGYPIAKPVIRIALGVNIDDIRIRSSSGMKIYQVSGAYSLLAEDAAEVHVQGQQDKLSEKFVVQAGRFRRKDDADAAAKSLRTKLAQRVYVAQNPESAGEAVFELRVGDFLTRGDALGFIRRTGSLGMSEAWIIREETAVTENHPHWVQLNGQLINLNADASLYFIPTSSESYLTFRGRDYRGILVLRGSRKGLILINVLNIEEYLKGVVPGELPPSYFSELEAQKAQAIAARTYALKNTGQFNDLGFDLYATPASQVYLGLSSEHPLSNRAVEETRGETVVFEGKLINALYMSTCGGATENVEDMFEGGPMPYLRSTECTLESESDWTVKSPAVFPDVTVDGKNVAVSLATLTALGVLPADTGAAGWNLPAGASEAVFWMSKAASLLGKKPKKLGSERPALDFPELARLLIDAFGWKERVENLMLKSETEHTLDGQTGLSAEERGALAYFVVSGITPASDRWFDRNRPVSRAEVASTIHKLLTTYNDFYHQGSIHSLHRNSITLHEDGKDRVLDIVPAVSLFREFGGEAGAAASLDLLAGDVVKWIETDGKIKLLNLVSASPSSVLDFTSQFHRWQVRISRSELQDRVNLYYPIGSLVDILPLKRGQSKRVLDLALVGREGQTQIRGLRIRQVLNLRDNLFVVDREHDAEGRISHFIFSGKGWGHGVGMCQIGAFRMAQKGTNYEDILKKYYRGIALKKMY
jgi:stage II sporulation protein D